MVHLQRMFAFMILSTKKFYNPSNVFKNVLNDFGTTFFEREPLSNRYYFWKGDRFKIGEQQDITEFNLNFLSRVEEGLFYCENNSSKIEDMWFG